MAISTHPADRFTIRKHFGVNGVEQNPGTLTMAVERSFLFVPGDRPERFCKALATRADRVIIDLEDAVATEAKNATRDALTDWLVGAEARDVVVRVNAAATPWHDDDLRAIAQLRRVVGVMLPKPKAPAPLQPRAQNWPRANPRRARRDVRGVADLRAVAGTPGLSRLAFGTVDFCLETGIQGQGDDSISFGRN